MRNLRLGPVAVIASIAVAAACAWLARWQLERAGAARALAERFDAAAALPALELPVDDVGAVLYRVLSAPGRYVPAPQVLLDNRVRDGIAGYEVLTAFEAAEHDRLVVVNRGWIRAASRREQLPDVAIDAGRRAIRGRVGALPRAALDLGAAPVPTGADVHVMSYPELADLEAVFGRPVDGFVLWLDASAAGALDARWAPPGDGGTRNVVYAGQWALFAIMAAGAGLVLIVRLLRRRRAYPE